VKSSDPQQLLDLIAQLLVLIECADRLPPSRERDAALREIIQYRDRLSVIVRRTLH